MSSQYKPPMGSFLPVQW